MTKFIYNIASGLIEFFIGGWCAMFFLAYVHHELAIGRPVGYWTSCVLAFLFRAGFNSAQRKDAML